MTMTTKEQGLPEAVERVLGRYMDARVFGNPHTRQVARAIRDEIVAAYADKTALASDTGGRGVAGSLAALADKWCENTETRENEIGYVRGVMFAHVSCANELRAALRAQPAGGGDSMREWAVQMAAKEAGQTVTAGAHGIPDEPTPPESGGQGDMDYTPGLLDSTAPPRIWLQVDTSASNDERDEAFPADIDGVTWQDESIGGLEVQYVRADLTHPTAQASGQGLAFSDATIDKLQEVMATHGFAVPVRVISDAFRAAIYTLAQGAGK